MNENSGVDGRRKNVIKSSDVNSGKYNSKESKPKKKDIIPNNIENNKIIIVFESGSGYVTKSNFKFTQKNKIAKLDYEEAMLLLKLDNFRLPTEEEIDNFNLSGDNF